MHPLLIFIFIACCSNVLGKNNVMSLTESLGQEVIEIGTPIKELPADIEEEPSIENEEDEHVTTTTVTISATTTTKPTTKRETKKLNAVATLHPKKPPNRVDTSEDEEDRIEKELAAIYKDNIDYKESSESTQKVVVTKATTTTTPKNITTNATKPIARSNDRDNFKFQPDPFNKAEIERFRTSVDDISCMKKLRQEGKMKDSKNSSCATAINIIVFTFCLLMRTSVN